MTRETASAVVLGTLLALLFGPPLALAQDQGLRLDDVVLADAIAVEILDREVIALDLVGSGRLSIRLEIDEEVLWSGARGRVAVVLTTRRVLGATPYSSSWRAERYHVAEVPVESAQLSQRLALVLTTHRALGFYGTGHWAEERLGPREEVMTSRVGPGAAVVVTERRALGLSPDSGGFFETKLRLGEVIESVNALSSIATITTSQRTLIFKGPAGRWIVQTRTLR